MMFTHSQIEKINAKLEAGETPEQIASGMGLSYTQFRSRLLSSGKRIVTYRRLEDTAPADKPRELATA